MKRSWGGYKEKKGEYTMWGRYDDNDLPQKVNDSHIEWFDSREEAEHLLSLLKKEPAYVKAGFEESYD